MAYVIRRVFKVKPGTHRQAQEFVFNIGEAYHRAGQRGAIRVYASGNTVPGPANMIYMDWVDESIQSPYREGNVMPEEMNVDLSQYREFIEESWIEFYELYKMSSGL